MNNSLNVKRIGLFYKQYYFINRNKLLLLLVATAGLIIGFHTFVHATNYPYLGGNGFQTQFHMNSFAIAMLIACLLWCGSAFPELRVKEKRMSYLIIPGTSLEKFTFEALNRIILLIIVFPIIYWLSTNLVTSIYHSFTADYEDFLFTYHKIIPAKLSGMELALLISIGLFMFTIPFAGASCFQKLPLIKTIAILTLVIGLFVGYIFLVVEGFDLKEYQPKNNRILFMRNEYDAQLAGFIAAIIGNITMLVISYFKLKEKEV